MLHDGPSFPLEAPSVALAGFPDGRWLIAAINARDEPNGRLLASDGTLLDRVHLGDAVEHLAVDAAGRIWVGWLDEGIFSNAERFRTDHTAVVAGCFSSDGSITPVGQVPQEAGCLADVYALTVAAEGAWTCPYTDLPLLHLVPNQPVRWWRNDITGASAMAVNDRYVLLAGGYDVDANWLALVELTGIGEGKAARLLATWRLALVRTSAAATEALIGRPVWEQPTLLAGRSDLLHLVVDGVWRSWRVKDAAASLSCA